MSLPLYVVHVSVLICQDIHLLIWINFVERSKDSFNRRSVYWLFTPTAPNKACHICLMSNRLSCSGLYIKYEFQY